jgi:hypothetical protein
MESIPINEQITLEFNAEEGRFQLLATTLKDKTPFTISEDGEVLELRLKETTMRRLMSTVAELLDKKTPRSSLES